MKYPYSKKEKLYRTVRMLLIMLLVIGAGIYTMRQHSVIVNPPGEFGSIQDIDKSAEQAENRPAPMQTENSSLLDSIPEYSGTPTYVLNGNKPEFTEEDYKKAESMYIELSELDWLGRCGTCEASLGKDTIPEGERDFDLSHVTPSGWKQARYPDLISRNSGWLYNRCHLIMYAVSGITDDPRNLVTGTEYMNVDGQLSYAEKATQNWLLRKGGRILYRATPVFKGNELVCRGVHIEAGDVESRGTKFHINVFCYNVEPGISIDYVTGSSWKTN